MRFVWLTAVKDLRRSLRDPAALAISISIPVFLVSMMWILFGRERPAPQGRLLIADEDQSLLSSFVASAFGQGELGNMLVVEKVKWEEGRRRMDRGEASALLRIPKGFGGAFLRNEPCRLTLVKNPAQQILPGIVEETLSIVVEGGSYLQMLLGDELPTFTKGPPADQTVAGTAVRINRLFTGLSKYLDPPAIKLETSVIAEQSPARTNFAAAFLPSMLFFALLFIAQSLGADLWDERNQGTLRRAASAPPPLAGFLAGKLLAASMLVGLVSAVALAFGHWAGGMEVGSFVVPALWMTASGAAFSLALALIQIHASNQRMAGILSNMVMFPLLMLGGSFFPFEMMPGGLAAIGRFTPNGWALTEFRALLAGAAGPVRIASDAGILALFGAIAFLIVVRRLRRAFLV